MQLKNKINDYMVVIAILVTVMTLSCTCHQVYPHVKGSGDPASEKRHPGEFNSVELKIPAEVFISAGNEHSVLIEADSNLIPLLTTDIRSKTLTLQSKKNISLSKNKIKIFIEMPVIKKLTTMGSGNIYVDDVFKNDYLSLKIMGSGNITIGTETGILESQIYGSGNLKLEGKAEKHKIDIRGSGDVLSKDLETDICNIRIMGSGNSYVKVNRVLDVNVSGSGDVYFSGSPSVSKTIRGSGKIIADGS